MFALPFTQKRSWLILAGAILLIALTPVGFANASFWTQILTIPSTIISLILQLLLLISENCLKLANALLMWTASGGIFRYSATNPANNPVINIGWTLLRDISNTLFVIGLAYIGLMTALDLSKFETKKTFSRLLIIALFINFSPVMCGAIVDFANIISGYFLQGVDFSMLVELFSRQRELIGKHQQDMITNGSILLQALMLIGFGVISSGILLLFAALFFVRTPALWILVILSPLMFFFWIFEKTQSWAKGWWSQFLQWSFIVLPASFFIYLSQHAVLLSQGMLNQELQGENPGGDVLTKISPYFVGIIFLIFGLIMALKINATGTGAIMRTAKTVKDRASAYGKAALKKPVTLAAGGLAAGAAMGAAAAVKGTKHQWDKRMGPALKPGQEGYDDWAKEHKARARMGKASRYVLGGETQEEREKWNKGWSRFGRGAARLGAGALTLGTIPAITKFGRKAGAAIEASDQGKIAEAGKKVAGMTDKQLIDSIKSAKRPTTQVGLLQEAIKAGRLSDIKDQLPEYLRKGIYNDAIRLGSAKSVKAFANADPQLMAKVLDEKNTNKWLPPGEKTVKYHTAETAKKIEEKKKEIDTLNADNAKAKELKAKAQKEELSAAEKKELKRTSQSGSNEKIAAANKELDDLRTDKDTWEKYQETHTAYNGLREKEKSGTITDEEREDLGKKRAQLKQDLRAMGTWESTIADEQQKTLGLALSDKDTKKLAEYKIKAAEAAKKAKDAGDLEAEQELNNWNKKKVVRKDQDGKDVVGDDGKPIEDWEEMSHLEQKVIINATADSAKDWDKKQAESIAKSVLFHLGGAPAVVTKLAEINGSEWVKAFQEKMEKLTGTTESKDPEKQEQFYRKIDNDRMANYLGGSAARNFGLGFSKLDKDAQDTTKNIADLSAQITANKNELTQLKDEEPQYNKDILSPTEAARSTEVKNRIAQLEESQERLQEEIDEKKDKLEEQIKGAPKVEIKYPELKLYVETNGDWRKGVSDAEKETAKTIMEPIHKQIEQERNAFLDANDRLRSGLSDQEKAAFEKLDAKYQKISDLLEYKQPPPPNP